MEYIIYLFIIISSLMVISSLNYTHAVFWIVLVFLLSASYFISLKYYYIGLIIIIIYVGAIAILFIFVIMMLNFKNFSKSIDVSNFIPISIFSGMCFFFEIMRVRPQYLLVYSNIASLNIKKLNNIEALGWNLYYVFYRPFVTACFILLIAMIGAILTQKIKLEVKKQDILTQQTRKIDISYKQNCSNNIIRKYPNELITIFDSYH